MLAHLLFRSAGLPARDNFRRPCVYHYPVDRRSSQNYFFTFCSVSLYGFQGTMLSVPLFASLRQLRYYITPLPLCQHFFRSLDFLDYFPFFPLFHSLFCTFRFILQISILIISFNFTLSCIPVARSFLLIMVRLLIKCLGTIHG